MIPIRRRIIAGAGALMLAAVVLRPPPTSRVVPGLKAPGTIGGRLGRAAQRRRLQVPGDGGSAGFPKISMFS
jgi:hypothetical protein